MNIGHASIDENKRSSGGNAGDQTGKEVCIRPWYSNSWGYVLRCKDEKIADIMANACEKACANNMIGYDQTQRNTLRTQAKKVGYDLSKISTPCETDCSAFMTVCAECAGIAIPYSGSNAPTTRTMQNAFLKTGMFDVLADKKYLTTPDNLKRGDILVKPGKHTVMALQNGANVSKSVQETKKTRYEVGKTYTLSANLYIREQPYGDKMKFSCITSDAQEHSKFDDYGNAILKKGTKVMCVDVKEESNSTWILIPSGWICAIEAGKVYIN